MKNSNNIMPYEVEVRLNSYGVETCGKKELGGKMALGTRQHNVTKFTPQKIYKTVGLTQKVYDDGTNTPCWVMFNDEGELQLATPEKFEKVKG
ncbi:MAG: hypothetical protein GY820_39050 [Gammaproteobacteria bacterium]|nr:hypothetical protein [Gammaproteobacteria bacterium]